MDSIELTLLANLIFIALPYSIYIAHRVSRNIGIILMYLFGGILIGGYIFYKIFIIHSIKIYFIIPILLAVGGTLLIYKMAINLRKAAYVEKIKLKYFICEVTIATILIFGPLFYYAIKHFGNIKTLKQITLMAGCTSMWVIIFALCFSRYHSGKERQIERVVRFIVLIILSSLLYLGNVLLK